MPGAGKAKQIGQEDKTEEYSALIQQQALGRLAGQLGPLALRSAPLPSTPPSARSAKAPSVWR